MFFLRALLVVGCAAGVAAADIMTLNWGNPTLPPEEPQGTLYWTNTPVPPATSAEIGALPVPDNGPNGGKNLLVKNADGTWKVSVNNPEVADPIEAEANRRMGGTGYIVLSWDGATPVVLDQNYDWRIEATWEIDSSIQQQIAIKKRPVKTILPLPNMVSASNSYLYAGTDFLVRTNKANFRIGAEWPNEATNPNPPPTYSLLGAWVVRNNNLNLSTAAQSPDGSTCINIGTLVNKITVRLEYTASTYSVQQYYGINGLPPTSILKHRFNVSPPQEVVNLERFNTYFQANLENDSFNLKVRGYATRSLGPIMLWGNVISGVESIEGEGGAEGGTEGSSEGSPEGSPEGNPEGEGEDQGDCGRVLAPCPNFDEIGYQLYNVAFGPQGYNWMTTDHDNNGMIDSWELAVFSQVLCSLGYRHHQACVCVFLANRDTFLTEQGLAADYYAYADVIAGLMSISSSMRQALINGLSLMGHYDVVHELDNSPAEPFSAQGNPDRDPWENFTEYANIMNNNLERSDYVVVALDPNLDGTLDPSKVLPVSNGMGLGVLAVLFGLAGMGMRLRKRSH